jgi:hypothetical protein
MFLFIRTVSFFGDSKCLCDRLTAKKECRDTDGQNYCPAGCLSVRHQADTRRSHDDAVVKNVNPKTSDQVRNNRNAVDLRTGDIGTNDQGTVCDSMYSLRISAVQTDGFIHARTCAK